MSAISNSLLLLQPSHSNAATSPAALPHNTARTTQLVTQLEQFALRLCGLLVRLLLARAAAIVHLGALLTSCLFVLQSRYLLVIAVVLLLITTHVTEAAAASSAALCTYRHDSDTHSGKEVVEWLSEGCCTVTHRAIELN